jgi:hypothetical protein
VPRNLRRGWGEVAEEFPELEQPRILRIFVAEKSSDGGIMSNSSMEDAYEKVPATASGAAEESPVKKQRKTPANYFIFPGDRRITGQHVVQLRQAIRVFSACADNWEISRHLQGLPALAQNQLKDADVKKTDASAVKRYVQIGIRDIRIAYPHAEGSPGPIGLRR